MHAASGFEVPGLRVRIRVFVSGRESSLVAGRVWTCCAQWRSQGGGGGGGGGGHWGPWPPPNFWW